MTESTRFPGQGNASSMADLVRECGRKLTNPSLWQEFQRRFHEQIVRYVLRAIRYRHKGESREADVAADLTQEVYLRLIRQNGRVLRSFRGDSEPSVRAFLARVALLVVSEHYKLEGRPKRQGGQVVSIDDRPAGGWPDEVEEFDVGSILRWVDVQRLIDADADRKNAARNVLIFKLYFIDGLTTAEIAQHAGFNLAQTGVERVLRSVKAQIQRGME